MTEYHCRPLTPQQQQDWEKKLTRHAYIVSMASNVLLGVYKTAKEMLKGTALSKIISSVDAVYAGLKKVYGILSDAYKEVKEGKRPDFSGEVPFPVAPPVPPEASNCHDSPSWFMAAWKIVEDGLKLLAKKHTKLAKFLHHIKEAGDDLVEELQKHFSPDHFHKYPTLSSFPSFPTAQLHPVKSYGQGVQAKMGQPVQFSINLQ